MIKEQLHERPPNSTKIFGEDEKFWYRCGAGKHVVNLLKKKVIPKGATIRIITREFREDKWGFKSDWYKFAEQKLIEGIKVKAYGGPGIEARTAVEKLCNLGMDVLEINDTPGKERLKEHYVTVDNPRIIWAEAEHVDFYAYGCIYTEEPYESAWLGVNKYFEDIERDGKWLTNDNHCERVTVSSRAR